MCYLPKCLHNNRPSSSLSERGLAYTPARKPWSCCLGIFTRTETLELLFWGIHPHGNPGVAVLGYTPARKPWSCCIDIYTRTETLELLYWGIHPLYTPNYTPMYHFGVCMCIQLRHKPLSTRQWHIPEAPISISSCCIANKTLSLVLLLVLFCC